MTIAVILWLVTTWGAPFVSVTSIMMAGLVGLMVPGKRGCVLGGATMLAHAVLYALQSTFYFGGSMLAPLLPFTLISVVLAGVLHAWLGQIVARMFGRPSAFPVDAQR